MEMTMGILDKMRLDGKCVLITGGARGIGKSIAEAIAQAGADVAIVDINLIAAQTTAADIASEHGIRSIAIAADVTKPADVDRMIDQTLIEFGRLDVVFCNAGIGNNVPAEQMTYEQWSQVINVNLTGVFLTAQAAGRVMIRQGGGSIITTASMSGHIANYPQPQCAYNASKAGVILLTKSLAVEWASKNIRVNSISPGYIGTELTLNNPAISPLVEQWSALTPQKRIGRPDELQSIAVYLAGDTSTYTTGSDFIIDGGFTSR
jgi:NAD(P)-dependent dehydrogenase (short-subunit alcohol dehydrogenase family)